VEEAKRESKKSSYIAIYISGQLRDSCSNNLSIPSLQVLISELKRQSLIPVIFFNINVKNSFKTSEWHYGKLIKDKVFPNDESIDNFMKQHDSTQEMFLNEIKTLECEYACNFYTDHNFINRTSVNFSNDPLCNTFLNDLGRKKMHEFTKIYPSFPDYWAKKGLCVHVNLRACYMTCYNMKIEFERRRNIQFEYIVITRPELIYRPGISKICTDTIYCQWDHFTMYPSYIHNTIMDNLAPIVQSVTAMSLGLLPDNSLFVSAKHLIEHIFLDLNDMSHYYNLGVPPIPFELHLIKHM
jgi:hypothetical protein